MSFPIKCFTCGKVIADKYRYYLEEVRKQKSEDTPILYLSVQHRDKTVEGMVLDKLNLFDACCRTRFLAHKEIFK